MLQQVLFRAENAFFLQTNTFNAMEALPRVCKRDKLGKFRLFTAKTSNFPRLKRFSAETLLDRLKRVFFVQ